MNGNATFQTKWQGRISVPVVDIKTVEYRSGGKCAIRVIARDDSATDEHTFVLRSRSDVVRAYLARRGWIPLSEREQ
jgi:hypothetical protein